MSQAVLLAERATAPQRPSAAVDAALTFITPSDKKPVFHSSASTGGAPQVLFETEPHRVRIRDLRPTCLAVARPRGLRAAPPCQPGRRPLRRRGGRERLLPGDRGAAARSPGRRPRRHLRCHPALGCRRRREEPRGPAWPGHPCPRRLYGKSGPQRAKDLLGEAEAARLIATGARIVQVNVWRPIRGPVRRSPLALADASSVEPEELVATDQVFPDRVGEIYHLAYAPGQRWYYAPEMTPDEVLLIKGWDSQGDGRARFTPHGAFELPDTPADAPPARASRCGPSSSSNLEIGQRHEDRHHRRGPHRRQPHPAADGSRPRGLGGQLARPRRWPSSPRRPGPPRSPSTRRRADATSSSSPSRRRTSRPAGRAARRRRRGRRRRHRQLLPAAARRPDRGDRGRGLHREPLGRTAARPAGDQGLQRHLRPASPGPASARRHAGPHRPPGGRRRPGRQAGAAADRRARLRRRRRRRPRRRGRRGRLATRYSAVISAGWRDASSCASALANVHTCFCTGPRTIGT